MLNFLKKKKIVPVVYMSGIIGNIGALRNGITISSIQDLLEKAFKIKNSALIHNINFFILRKRKKKLLLLYCGFIIQIRFRK